MKATTMKLLSAMLAATIGLILSSCASVSLPKRYSTEVRVASDVPDSHVFALIDGEYSRKLYLGTAPVSKTLEISLGMARSAPGTIHIYTFKQGHAPDLQIKPWSAVIDVVAELREDPANAILRSTAVNMLSGLSPSDTILVFGRPDSSQSLTFGELFYYEGRTYNPHTGRLDGRMQVVFERGKATRFNFF